MGDKKSEEKTQWQHCQSVITRTLSRASWSVMLLQKSILDSLKRICGDGTRNFPLHAQSPKRQKAVALQIPSHYKFIQICTQESALLLSVLKSYKLHWCRLCRCQIVFFSLENLNTKHEMSGFHPTYIINNYQPWECCILCLCTGCYCDALSSLDEITLPRSHVIKNVFLFFLWVFCNFEVNNCCHSREWQCVQVNTVVIPSFPLPGLQGFRFREKNAMIYFQVKFLQNSSENVLNG